MACLKEYIARLDEDITVLETATSYVSKIVSSQDEVDSSLTMLQTYYEATVNASDELISEFHKLNDGAVGAATRIKTTIDGALQTARIKKREAVEAEKSCPECHPENGG